MRILIFYDNAAYKVEFVTGGGKIVVVLTLLPEDIRPFRNQEILHARQLAPG